MSARFLGKGEYELFFSVKQILLYTMIQLHNSECQIYQEDINLQDAPSSYVVHLPFVIWSMDVELRTKLYFWSPKVYVKYEHSLECECESINQLLNLIIR